MDLNDLKLQWEALEPWKKALIILIFSAGIMYLIYTFKLENILIEKEKLEKDIKSLSQQIEFLKRTSNPQKIAQLNKKIEEINAKIKEKKLDLEKLKKIVPDEAKIDELLKVVAENAYKSNLGLEKFKIVKSEKVYVSYDSQNKSIKIRTSKSKKSRKERSKSNNEVVLYRLIANLNLTGTPKDLIKYINYLSNSKTFIIIDDVKLDKVKNKININMNISTFYSKGEKT